jgi:hypothetical protein
VIHSTVQQAHPLCCTSKVVLHLSLCRQHIQTLGSTRTQWRYPLTVHMQ